MSETAHVQGGVTIRQAAVMAGVSERMIHYAKRLDEVRPDLGDLVLAGDLSMRAACIEAGIRRDPSTWDRLIRAWTAATDEDRRRLLRKVGAMSPGAITPEAAPLLQGQEDHAGKGPP